MRDSSSGVLDPRTAMNSNCTPGDCPSPGEVDFRFAFNDSNFSDRLLRIEIVDEPVEARSDTEGCTSIADWARRKRRKDNGNENGDGIASKNDLNWSMNSCANVRAKTLHISSAILAAKSSFFYKLFSNRINESGQRNVTLRINGSEEASLMELLNFIYCDTISVTSAPAFLDLLMTADKFEVTSCLRYCSKLLQDFHMTPESALLYLELPSMVSMSDTVQPLINAAKNYLAARYSDLIKCKEEILALPVAGLEAVLSNDNLEAPTEDFIYGFILEWASKHYPNAENRREILGRLAHHIRFPYMSCQGLLRVWKSNDFNYSLAYKFLLQALFFKTTPRFSQASLAENASSNYQFSERPYKCRPVKVVEFELPHQQCVVYLDLKRDECANLLPSGRVATQLIYMGDQSIFLLARCNPVPIGSGNMSCFGVFIVMPEVKSPDAALDFEIAARFKPGYEFVSQNKGSYRFTDARATGYGNLLSLPWMLFMSVNSPYFINDVLYLRVELTFRH